MYILYMILATPCTGKDGCGIQVLDRLCTYGGSGGGGGVVDVARDGGVEAVASGEWR